MIYDIKIGPETRLQPRPALTTAKGAFAMAKSELPSPELLRKLLNYDPETGALTWRERDATLFTSDRQRKGWNTRSAGKPALNWVNGVGYRDGFIFNVRYQAHRVAWAVAHGEWPKQQIDHINGDRSDNRLCNLRDVSNTTNARNQKRRSDNTSGHCGVYWVAQKQKWNAQIKTGGRSKSLGYFVNLEEAIAARKAAEQAHGFHPNHGRNAA